MGAAMTRKTRAGAFNGSALKGLGRSRAAGIGERLLALATRARGPAYWLALVASMAAFAYVAWLYIDAQRQNALIQRLAGGEDVAIDIAAAPDAILLARADYLLARDRIDEAQTIADVAAARNAPETRAALLYNLANARLRIAIEAIEQGALDKAIASVNLAKTAYRLALRIDPEAWDAKYNLDIAMRLVRDLPQQDDTAEDKSPEEPKQLWTDLPGIPKGLP
jgi:mxaK protein